MSKEYFNRNSPLAISEISRLTVFSQKQRNLDWSRLLELINGYYSTYMLGNYETVNLFFKRKPYKQVLNRYKNLGYELDNNNFYNDLQKFGEFNEEYSNRKPEFKDFDFAIFDRLPSFFLQYMAYCSLNRISIPKELITSTVTHPVPHVAVMVGMLEPLNNENLQSFVGLAGEFNFFKPDALEAVLIRQIVLGLDIEDVINILAQNLNNVSLSRKIRFLTFSMKLRQIQKKER